MSDDSTLTQQAGPGFVGHASAPVSPYFTATEAAMYLRTTVQGIYSLVKRSRLKPMPGSGRLLFTRDALDACLTRRRR